VLETLLTEAFGGQSRVVVLRGEAGVGKTFLLKKVSDRLDGWQIAKAVGVESEIELAYSGLHQLCVPVIDRLERLPEPQREALSTVFGLSAGPTPDRFLVGLATLTLFAEAAEQEPLALIVDDAQWLDQASEQILAFVARRVFAERIAIVCVCRTGVGDHVLAGLPELKLGGLADRDARALLLANVAGPLDAVVCDQIVAESHGNPLALLELPRSGYLAGGFGVPDLEAVTGRIEQSYARRLESLPPDTRLIVLAAAAEPRGDPALLNRAIATMGLDFTATDPAMDDGLIRIDARVEFAHPLVRSTAYRLATAEERRRVHRALADATDPESNPDYRAWHRAHATAGPNDEVAVELEQSAGRAQARGGIAAAAAFLDRAVTLTVDPELRAERALSAAQTSTRAGEFDAALRLLAIADEGPRNDARSARADLLRGQIGFASGLGDDVPRALIRAAKALEPLDLDLARETYLHAWNAVCELGGVEEKDMLLEIARSVRALPPTAAPRPVDALLDALAILSIEGFAAAVPPLVAVFEELLTLSVEDVLRWGAAAMTAGIGLWGVRSQYELSITYADLVRKAGALSELTFYLSRAAVACIRIGDFPQAAMLIAEGEGIAAATGTRFGQGTRMRLLAMQGKEAEALEAIEAALKTAAGTNEARAHWAAAVLNNGLGRYEQAAAAARRATQIVYPILSRFALPELVEAAARSGDIAGAGAALEQLIEITHPANENGGLGLEARCRALLSEGPAAEDAYREAVERLATEVRPDSARAHLLYGEWLRREGRRVDAREHLRIAHEMFDSIGMEAFAERTRRELIATGEKVRKRSDEKRGELTPQEEQIAQLARSGLSNPEIGTQLFLSARTIEWHLRHVYQKLGIGNRSQLRSALPERALGPIA
jgi:DNA-binding CsgD family transcriptional regulator